jgi:hypothetical protein
MGKKITGMPKALYAGRTVKLAGKTWVVQEAYSERLFGSEKIFRTVCLVLTD